MDIYYNNYRDSRLTDYLVEGDWDEEETKLTLNNHKINFKNDLQRRSKAVDTIDKDSNEPEPDDSEFIDDFLSDAEEKEKQQNTNTNSNETKKKDINKTSSVSVVKLSNPNENFKQFLNEKRQQNYFRKLSSEFRFENFCKLFDQYKDHYDLCHINTLGPARTYNIILNYNKIKSRCPPWFDDLEITDLSYKFCCHALHFFDKLEKINHEKIKLLYYTLKYNNKFIEGVNGIETRKGKNFQQFTCVPFSSETSVPQFSFLRTNLSKSSC